jgi:hypothetical protein
MGDEITMHGYRVLTFAECTTIMLAELVVTSGLGSSIEYMGVVMEWFGYGMVLVWVWNGFGMGMEWLWHGIGSR